MDDDDPMAMEPVALEGDKTSDLDDDDGDRVKGKLTNKTPNHIHNYLVMIQK